MCGSLSQNNLLLQHIGPVDKESIGKEPVDKGAFYAPALPQNKVSNYKISKVAKNRFFLHQGKLLSINLLTDSVSSFSDLTTFGVMSS
jgi:hypothetical protein